MAAVLNQTEEQALTRPTSGCVSCHHTTRRGSGKGALVLAHWQGFPEVPESKWTSRPNLHFSEATIHRSYRNQAYRPTIRGRNLQFSSRNNCKHSGGKPRASLRLGECDDHHCPVFRDLVQVGEQLDLISILGKDVGFQ